MESLLSSADSMPAPAAFVSNEPGSPLSLVPTLVIPPPTESLGSGFMDSFPLPLKQRLPESPHAAEAPAAAEPVASAPAPATVEAEAPAAEPLKAAEPAAAQHAH